MKKSFLAAFAAVVMLVAAAIPPATVITAVAVVASVSSVPALAQDAPPPPLPSGCGPGTLNDTCPPPVPSGCGPGTDNSTCPLPSGCGAGTLNNTCPPSNDGTGTDNPPPPVCGGADLSGPEFRAEASGDNKSLTLRATVRPRSGWVGREGRTYVGAFFGLGWFFLTERGWEVWVPGRDPPYYSSGILCPTTVTILDGRDVSSHVGVSIWVGYGPSFDEMRYWGAYTPIYLIGGLTPIWP